MEGLLGDVASPAPRDAPRTEEGDLRTRLPVNTWPIRGLARSFGQSEAKTLVFVQSEYFNVDCYMIKEILSCLMHKFYHGDFEC